MIFRKEPSNSWTESFSFQAFFQNSIHSDRMEEDDQLVGITILFVIFGANLMCSLVFPITKVHRKKTCLG